MVRPVKRKFERIDTDEPEGIEQRITLRERKDPLGALILIAAGVLLLLNNFGILSWDVWNILWRFWPVLLIFAGLNIIFSGSILTRFIVTLTGALIIGLIIAYAVARVNPDFRSWFFSRFPELQILDRQFERQGAFERRNLRRFD